MPGDRERYQYYFGLLSRPELVARSSSFRWTPSPHPLYRGEGLAGKFLRTVGRHPIVAIWCDAVRNQLAVALSGLDWRTVDVFRVGQQGESAMPVTLLVSVPEGSTTWGAAKNAALACRNVLRHNGIFDVECEIWTGHITKAGIPPLVKPKLQKPDQPSQVVPSLNLAPFMESIGQSLAMLMTPRDEGTLGLYLNVGDNICALTCRHVVLESKTEAEAQKPYYFRFGTGTRLLPILQPGDVTLDTVLKSESACRKESKGQVRAMEALTERTPVQDRRLQHFSQTGIDSLAIEHEIGRRTTHSSRIIGHLLYAPPFAQSSPGGFMMDWALIKLTQDKYTTRLRDLKNTVWLGPNAGQHLDDVNTGLVRD